MKLLGPALCLQLLLGLPGFVAPVDAAKPPGADPAMSRRTMALRAALESADRLEIHVPWGQGVLHQVAGKKKLADLLLRIRIDDSESGFHCMCDGDFHLHFLAGKKKLSVLGYHHNRSLRWHQGQWKGDSLLAADSAGRLIDWFSAHGFEQPAQQRQEKLAREAAERKREETFTGCFRPHSRRHFKFPDRPDLNHDEKVAIMGRNLISSYDDRLQLLKDICRGFGTRPLPWNHFGFADQIGQSAAYQIAPDWFVKLASTPDALTAPEMVGFCVLILKHPDLAPGEFAGLEAQICEILGGALAVPMDPGYLSKILLWHAKHTKKGVADVIAPFVSGGRALKFVIEKEGFREDPSPRAIAALALALLGDDRVVAPAERALQESSSPSPSRSALRLALAHAKGRPELFTLEDHAWDTYLLYESVHALAHRHPSKHTYDLVIIGGSRHSWAIVREEAVLEFQALTGQRWFQDRENERADWHGKDAREWWIQHRETFPIPVRRGP